MYSDNSDGNNGSSSNNSATAASSSSSSANKMDNADNDNNTSSNSCTSNDGNNSSNDIHGESIKQVAKRIMSMGKKDASSYINVECCHGGTTPELNMLLDYLFDPDQPIDNSESIEWVRWLIAGGRTPGEFASIVRSYDNHAKCGLVWVPHVVAYRCRTCGISPCMSICRDCFKKGDHTNHDFNMFLSQAGGACDCGDASVMKAEGFCSDHGINDRANKGPIPHNLLAVAEAIMPKLLFRLLHYFREFSYPLGRTQNYGFAANKCEEFVNMLMDLNNMGELMRRVMTRALINPDVYKTFMDQPFSDTIYGRFLKYSYRKYEDAVKEFPRSEPPDDYAHLPALGETLHHSTLLEEFIFWTFKYEFPQNLVCFLLNMLPDQDYKEHLTRTFVMHYSRIPSVLEISSDPDTLSNRVVHMSVQLFSNESLALKMVEELNLLHVMIISLKMMMSKILIPSTLHDPQKNYGLVIDCAKRVMKEHCYWPLVSDFNNVLSHESVALVFLRDDNLIDMWFQFLTMLQGMNENIRETANHVEFEPSSYYAAFSCELEASAYPMWSIISHLKDGTHAQLAKKILTFCINSLQQWLATIYFIEPKIEKSEMMRTSFHFPLHRYLAAFTCQAVTKMGMKLSDILPPPDLLTLLMIHPLRVQSFFYEILAGIWVRNGLQIKGQAMTYIQANFCNSMVDMDLFFLQICATQLPPQTFLTTTIDLFGISEWLNLGPLTSPQEMEQDSMLEGFLTFLATLVTSRTNLGNDEQTQCIIEISALLATENKTHSQLLELMPERSGNIHTKNFEKFLKQLSVYKAPTSGSENLEQGMFTPIDDIWEKYYDPLHVLLRAVHRRDFQSSMDRFSNYVKSKNKMPKSGNLWPPFRLPRSVGKGFNDPCCILNSRVFHSTLLAIFYRAVHSHNVSEHLLALSVFLLEIAVNMNENLSNDALVECEKSANSSRSTRDAPELLHCYPSDCLNENLRLVVSKVSLTPQEPQVCTANYNTTTFDSDLEWDVSESDTLQMLTVLSEPEYSSDSVMVVPTSGMEVALPQDLSVVREQSLVIHSSSSQDEDISDETSQNEGAVSINSYDTQLALPSSLALPSITLPESGMEVAIRRELDLTRNETTRQPNEMFSPTMNNVNAMLLPFQRVQPVAVPSRNLDVVPSNSMGARRTFSNGNRKRAVESAISLDSDTVMIQESILSLLLKLHSQLSGTLDSFSFEDNESISDDNSMDYEIINEAGSSSSSSATAIPSSTESSSHHIRNRIQLSESRIGDGPFFIGNLLRKIAKQSETCAKSIEEIRQKLWPNQREKQAEQRAREAREKEERSKRAKERQQKLMQEFANKQKQFMEMATEMECGDENDEDEMEQPREKEYDCIICNRASASTESNPIGLVVLVESSGVVGHRRKSKKRLPLPLCKSDFENLVLDSRLAIEFNRRIDLLSLKFGEESWYLSYNNCYDTGVHVQSCGHHVHLSCLDAYLNSLYPTQRQNLHVERGEFYCPVCRQLSNSVLPLSPQLDRLTPLIRSAPQPFATLVSELTTLIKENENPSISTKLSEAMGRAMEDITSVTHTKVKRIPPTFRSLFLFVTSIARTNLESEIIQRGGSLCENNVVRYRPKRECIVPLLHVLSLHVRVLVEWPLWRSWAALAGFPINDTAPVPSHCRDFIPSLLADPVALLLKYILLAPLHLDQVYFTCIVKVMYNLLYYQIVVQLCTTLTDLECDEIISKYYLNVAAECSSDNNYSNSGDGDGISDKSGSIKIENLGSALAFVLMNTDRCQHLRRKCVNAEHGHNHVDMESMELRLEKLCLSFLRIAALLRHHLYRQELPDIDDPRLEFVSLIYYLELATDGMDWECYNASKSLCFIPGTEITLPQYWLKQLMDVRPPSDTIRELVMNLHIRWRQPKLLGLPREYERLFTFYHERPCLNCLKIPKESSICLLCGTIVCLKQNCCVENDCCEAVRHTISCGGGIGIFLVVTSTYIIVIRGRRACLWGSLYLDDFDEEDRDLKRGKPLYLSKDRFNLLESQWLSHRFAHTKHTWVFHRDLL